MYLYIFVFEACWCQTGSWKCVPPDTCWYLYIKIVSSPCKYIYTYLYFEACWVPGRKLLLLKSVVFSHLFNGKSLVVFNKQTAVVLTPLTLYARACVVALLFLLCLSPCFLGGAAIHSMRVTLLDFFSGGAAALRPNNLRSTPPIQNSAIETALMEFPSMLK